jgi:small subunit ribosomal protein S11
VSLGVNRVQLRLQAPGTRREPATPALAAAGLFINSIHEVTPLPHNGCRPPQKRRV